VRHLLDHKIQDKAVAVKIDVTESLPPIKGDPNQLQQVFINLFLNSLHALQPGGTIKISAAMSPGGNGEDAEPNRLSVEFEDNGAGMPAEHLSQVFDPFFTTKDVGEGTGLGLSVSYGIIKDHGGEIRVESQSGQFTRFIISLPVGDRAAYPVGPSVLQ
jgi:signal transduction histidine kinase